MFIGKFSNKQNAESTSNLRDPLSVAESKTTSYIFLLRNLQQNKCADKIYVTGICTRNPLKLWNISRDLSLESTDILTQNCALIQCTVMMARVFESKKLLLWFSVKKNFISFFLLVRTFFFWNARTFYFSLEFFKRTQRKELFMLSYQNVWIIWCLVKNTKFLFFTNDFIDCVSSFQISYYNFEVLKNDIISFNQIDVEFLKNWWVSSPFCKSLFDCFKSYYFT